MARFGFVGPSYQSESVNVDAQRTMNWYPETTEGGNSATIAAMYPTWGLKKWTSITDANGLCVTQLYVFNQRLFGTTGANGTLPTKFCEINSSGAISNLQTILADTNPASLASNNAGQLIVCSGGKLNWFSLTNNSWNTPQALQGNAGKVDFIDGYFLTYLTGTQKFQWSNLEDANTWDPAKIAQVNQFAENIIGMLVVRREIWFWSPKRTMVYFDSGDNLNPFQPIEGAFIEQGLSATNSPICLGNAPYWIGANESGEGMAWSAQGWTPRRISTHAVETAWQRYSRIDDAISCGWQQHGHFIWETYFPTADATWRYDVDANMWHEAGYWNLGTSKYQAHRSRCHAYAFGMHLVGDTQSTNVYQMAPQFTDDDGNPLRRYRRAPHLNQELEWQFHHKLRIHLESGLGPIPALPGTAIGLPAIFLQDPAGNQWQVQVNDDGTMSTSSLGPNSGITPQTYIFADIGLMSLPSQIPTRCYQLNIDNSGALYLTLVKAPGGGWIQQLLMMTQPSALQTRLTVQFGQLVVDPPVAPTREPQVMLRWSDDGGHTWSNEYTCGAGSAGEFTRKVEWRRLGRTRDRVYEISTSDPVSWRVVDAYLFATPGFQPVERYPSQMAKMA
jgi:hypothetical protein